MALPRRTRSTVVKSHRKWDCRGPRPNLFTEEIVGKKEVQGSARSNCVTAPCSGPDMVGRGPRRAEEGYSECSVVSINQVTWIPRNTKEGQI